MTGRKVHRVERYPAAEDTLTWAVRASRPTAAAGAPVPALLALAGVAILVTVWLALAWALGPALLPGPTTVGRLLWAEARTGALPFHLLMTLWRVAASTALAMMLGSSIGVWMGLSRKADAFFAPWLIVGLAVPRLLIIVVAYLLAGLNEAALIAAATLATAPSVLVSMREGIRAVDWKLVDMARAFEIPPARRWRWVIGPQLLPYLAGTARAAVSLNFKIVLFAELMGRPSGVGYQVHFYFQMFNMGRILAYGLATVVVAALLEGLMRALERRLWNWRPVTAR